MNSWDALRAITRRALNIYYASPAVCESGAVPASGSGASPNAATLDFLPVFRAAAPVLTVSAFSAGNLRLAWSSVVDAFVYVAYKSTSPDGPFVVIASGIQNTFYVDAPEAPGTYFYRVSGIEPDHGESELSNVASGTV